MSHKKSNNMVIHDLLQQLETSVHPVSRSINKGEKFNVLVIGFKKGMLLKDHQAKLPSKLVVLQGEIIYRSVGAKINLTKFESTDIPAGDVHSVEAITDSLCLLSQG